MDDTYLERWFFFFFLHLCISAVFYGHRDDGGGRMHLTERSFIPSAFLFFGRCYTPERRDWNPATCMLDSVFGI